MIGSMWRIPVDVPMLVWKAIKTTPQKTASFESVSFAFLTFLSLCELAKRRWSLESAGCLELVFLICCWMPQCVMPHMHNACETDIESLQH